MKERKKAYLNSLVAKLILSMCLIFLPLITIHMISERYAIDTIKEQVIQSNTNLLTLHTERIDYSLREAANYIYQLSAHPDLYYYSGDSEIELNDFVEAKLRLHKSITAQASFYPFIDAVFVYSVLHDDLIYSYFGSSFDERLATSTEVREALQTESANLISYSWNIWQGEDRFYLIYLQKHDNVYVGTWVNMEHLITSLQFLDFGDTGEPLLAVDGYGPVSRTSFLKETEISLEEPTTVFGGTERYLVIPKASKVADFHVLAAIPEDAIFDKISRQQRVSLFVISGVFSILLVFVFLMRGLFLDPIRRLVRAMRESGHGNLDIRLEEEKSSTELAILSTSFNRMMEEIKALKIDNYERTITQKNAELKQLQAQINPHFFLNSLNIIYSLATAKEYALIQEMAKSLAEYFRFMFRSGSFFVDFQAEILHTENYLNIQRLRFPDAFVYKIDFDSDLADCQVPPLMIQSFVENSIKHAFRIDDPIEMTITVRRWSADPKLAWITIEDTGPGFPEDVLATLQNGRSLITEGAERFGIWNVQRRLELLYGENGARFKFSNGSTGGARVDLWIPIK